MAVDGGGNVYVADAGNHRIQVFNSTGAYIAEWGEYGTGPGEFNNPCGIAVDLSGRVYVADQGNHRIQVFGQGPTPTTQETWGAVKTRYRGERGAVEPR